MGRKLERAVAALLVAAVLGGMIWMRSLFAGWLLPDGHLLEALAQQVRSADCKVAEVIFTGVQGWLEDE